MTAAEDRREDLEAVLHRGKVPAPLQAEILAAADAWARAYRPRVPKKPPGPDRPPSVHYVLTGRDRAACRPHDSTTRGWLLTPDRRLVTCGHCLKVLDRDKAGGPS